ncbi:MAG: DUF1993 family protein [Rhodopila sp.]
MSFSVYEITVPLMVQGLTVLDDYLNHAQALERERGMEPGEALEARLAPDMLSRLSTTRPDTGGGFPRVRRRQRANGGD